MNRLQGKKVLITGGMRGIGKTTAERFAKQGAAVCITSRQADPVMPTRPSEAGDIRLLPLDVTDEASVHKLFQWLDEVNGGLDVLVNNAGIGVFQPIAQLTLSVWEEVFKTNVTGLFLCSREAFQLMKKRGGGRIINISSVSGYLPLAENGVYGASKYAVRGFSQICNEEWKHDNVFVTLVSAGAVCTEITDGRLFNPADMLKTEDVAEAILDIAGKPPHVRIDEVRLLPPKGVL